MMLQVLPEASLGTEAVVTEDTEQRRLGVSLAEQLVIVNENFRGLNLGILQHISVVVLQVPVLWSASEQAKSPEEVRGISHLPGYSVDEADHLFQFFILSFRHKDYSLFFKDGSGEEYFLQKLGQARKDSHVSIEGSLFSNEY